MGWMHDGRGMVSSWVLAPACVLTACGVDPDSGWQRVASLSARDACGVYQTYSQGFYGSFNGSTVLSPNFASLAGGDGVYPIGTGYQLSFSSASSIQNYLPATGTPGILTGSILDPITSPSGVFGGQVLTMRLNLDLSNLGVLPPNLGSLVVNSIAYDGASTSFLGKTIATIVAESERVLGSGPVASASVYNRLLTDLVAAFDGVNALTPPGSTASAFLSCPQVPLDPTVSGMKYYDANANGQLDPGESGLSSWPIAYSGTATGSVLTTAGGTFSVDLAAGTCVFQEVLPTNSYPAGPWYQTGNTVDQTGVTGGATAQLTSKVYSLQMPDGSGVTGVNFGNVCLGGGGGLTIGSWKNLKATAVPTRYTPWQGSLVALNLVDAGGQPFDPTEYASFAAWLNGAQAVNMAYMLSAQLAAMELSVWNGLVGASRMILAPGTLSANASGFASVQAVMAEANVALGVDGYTPSGDPRRAYQELLKTALDNASNNRTFVAPGPSGCADPIFP
ncbi:MAG: hypothetical protein VKP72_09465 [bacterium]|nr:hypothetical protein [bacterium]